MYSIINVLVHVIGISLIIFSLIKDPEYHDRNAGTIEGFALLVALGLLGSWALVVGEIQNLKSLFALIW